MIEDYRQYRFNRMENIRCFLQGMLFTGMLGYLFYHNWFAVLFLSPLILVLRKKKKKQLTEQRKWKINQEFKDGIISLSAALSSGYSAENAFEEAWKDLKLLYPENALIMQEFSYIINQLRMNITVEKALNEFAERTGVEDILNFAEIFSTAKRSGGDLIKVIQSTANAISDKVEVKREIITLITAKKYEADIMKIIPPGIILYLQFFSPGFLDPLYQNILGRMVMSILLIAYLCAYHLADKIVAIEV
ncbi:MAG: pilus assembly protein TadB [Lachnospiraceae bacterium]|nr:pilus assembly protein TadB [Lachnospiraceae bacterium]